MSNNTPRTQLFDKKFLSNTLRIHHRCPNCRNEYSFDKLSKEHPMIRSNRPFLLPCGHNMCENCVYHNRNNLCCKICCKPIQLPQSQALLTSNTSSGNFFATDHFDINFFLAGKIHHLNCYQKTPASSNSQNSMLNKAGFIATDANTIQCKECDIVPACGKCRQCRDNLCQKCFQRIHASSKTLKTHYMISIRDQDIDIDDIFFAKKEKYCRLHKRNYSCFCPKCQQTMCADCAHTKHNQHNFVKLTDENTKVLDNIAIILENVQTARDQVKKSQKNIQHVENQLKDYAIRTLEDITNYFIQMHSFLQNQEKKIIENLHSMSVQPQFELQEANGKLVQSEYKLNKIRANLECYQNKLPNDINLAPIVKKCYNVLEQIPCQIEISKPQSNPFIFEVISDITKDFRKNFKSYYNDPKIEIKLRHDQYKVSILNRSSSNSNNTQKMHSGSRTVSTSKPKSNKNKKKQLKNSRNNISMDVSDTLQANNTMDADSADSIPITPAEVALLRQKSSIHLMELPATKEPTAKFVVPKKDDLFRLANCITPENFYLQNIAIFNKIRALTHTNLDNSMGDQVFTPIAISNYYMTYHETDKQWYRAQVKRILPNSFYKMFLVDFGISVDVGRDHLSEMEEKCAKIPYAAIHCALHGLMPAGSNWHDDAKGFLIEMLQNKPARISIIEKYGENFKIDLHTQNIKSIKEAFLYTGLARMRPGDFKMELKHFSSLRKLENTIPKFKFHAHGMIRVNILHIEGPQEFYVIRSDKLKEKDEFKTKLNDHYSADNYKPQRIFLGVQQQICAVECDGVWHRAVLEKVKGKGNNLVHFIDEGKRDNVNWSQLFMLEAEFRKTCQYAICCSLADIEPAQEHGYTYTPECINDFKQMLKNPQIKMDIIHAESSHMGHYKVALYVEKDNKDINIGASLVINGHGVSTGEATQIGEVTKTPKKRLNIPFQHTPFAQRALNPINISINKSALTSTDAINENVETYEKAPSISKASIKRTPITISFVVDPGKFYINLTNLSKGSKTFHEQIQEKQQTKYPQLRENFELNSFQEKSDWCVDDHCLVYTLYRDQCGADNLSIPEMQEREWFRGIVTNIHFDAGVSASLYTVFLRDIGATIRSIAGCQLFTIDSLLDRVTNAAICCHLACIEPAGGKSWSLSAIDCLQFSLQKYEALSASLYVKRSTDKTSLPIILWGSITETADPLAPCVTKYTNINRLLVKSGLAHMVERLNMAKECEEFEKMPGTEGEISVKYWVAQFLSDSIIKKIDSNEPEVIPDIDNTVEYKPNHSMNYHLEEVSIDPTTGQTSAPQEWLHSNRLNKDVFLGYPSYIDNQCIIYIYEHSDKDFLEKMSIKMTDVYDKIEQPPQNYKYKKGQPVVAKYHQDNKFYRAFLLTDINGQQQYSAYFIDYGNVEIVEAHELRPYAPFPNLPSFTNKMEIDGIKPKNGAKQYETIHLDFMHKFMVSKLVTVRVVKNQNGSRIKKCTLTVGSIDAASHFIQQGWVDSIFTNSCNLNASLNSVEGSTARSTSKSFQRSRNPLPTTEEANMDYYFTEQERPDFCVMQNIHDDEMGDESDNSSNQSDYSLGNTRKQKTCQMDDIFKKEVDKNKGKTPTTTQNLTQPPIKRRMFDDRDYSKMMNDLGVFDDNLRHNYINDADDDVDEDDCDDGIDYMFEDENVEDYNDPMNYSFIDKTNDVQNPEDDVDIVELEQTFAQNYWLTNAAEMSLHSNYELKPENKKKEEQKPKTGLQEEQDLHSEFDGFYPNDASTVLSYFSGIDNFKLPQLPLNMTNFNCIIISVITSTILQILPHHKEFHYRDVELQNSIKHVVENRLTKRITKYETRTVCLARFTKDGNWYRALIRSYNPLAATVDVLYVDYLNSETLSVRWLLQCPEHLLQFPLRSFHVRLHGVKPNPELKESDIRLALNQVLPRKGKILAVIKKQPVRKDETCSDLAGVRQSLFGSLKNDLMEVSLYESEELFLKAKTIYESLLDKKYFIRN